jgi:capsular exopolysaccharide synthesis family protein
MTASGAPTSLATEPGLRDHLAVLVRRRWTILLAIGLAVAASLLVSLTQTPRYRSEAVVQVPTATLVVGPEGVNLQPERIIRNEVDFVGSDAVQDAFDEALGSQAAVVVDASDDRDALTFSATSTDADEAARIANTFAETYVAVRSQASVDAQRARAEELQAQIDAANADIAELQQSIADIEEQARTTPDAAEQAAFVAQAQARRVEVQPQVDSLTAERIDLQAQLDAASEATEAAEGTAPVIITRAAAAASPYEPATARNLVIAFGLGALIGIGLAFVREQLDDTVTTRAELEAATGGVPVLALVPRSGDGEHHGVRGRVGALGRVGRPTHDHEPAPLAVSQSTGTPAAEAYRSLRTSVRFLDVERPLRTLLVTSPTEGDGKTTTVANLAVAVARSGQRCVVVCGDLRQPRVHEHLGVAPEPGLTSLLLGEVTLDEALQPVPHADGLRVLAAGGVPPNPSELLSSDAAIQVLERVGDGVDLVLIDSPPVLPVTDALVLAQQVDGVVLVADARHTGLPEIREAFQRLEQVGAPLVGTVLNSAEGTVGSYSYGYAPTR